MFSKCVMIINIALQRNSIVLPVLLVQPVKSSSTGLLRRKCCGVGVRRGVAVLNVVNKRLVPLFLNIIIRVITNSAFYTQTRNERKLLFYRQCGEKVVGVLTEIPA